MTARTLCPICFDVATADGKNLAGLRCGHVFHKECILKWYRSSAKGCNRCPNCKAAYRQEDIISLFFQTVGNDNCQLDAHPLTAESLEVLQSKLGYFETKYLQSEAELHAERERVLKLEGEVQKKTNALLELQKEHLRHIQRSNEGLQLEKLKAAAAEDAKVQLTRAKRALEEELNNGRGEIAALQGQLAAAELAAPAGADMDAEEVERTVSMMAELRTKEQLLKHLAKIISTRNTSIRTLNATCRSLSINYTKADHKADIASAKVKELQARMRQMQKVLQQKEAMLAAMTLTETSPREAKDAPAGNPLCHMDAPSERHERTAIRASAEQEQPPSSLQVLEAEQNQGPLEAVSKQSFVHVGAIPGMDHVAAMNSPPRLPDDVTEDKTGPPSKRPAAHLDWGDEEFPLTSVVSDALVHQQLFGQRLGATPSTDPLPGGLFSHAKERPFSATVRETLFEKSRVLAATTVSIPKPVPGQSKGHAHNSALFGKPRSCPSTTGTSFLAGLESSKGSSSSACTSQAAASAQRRPLSALANVGNSRVGAKGLQQSTTSGSFRGKGSRNGGCGGTGTASLQLCLPWSPEDPTRRGTDRCSGEVKKAKKAGTALPLDHFFSRSQERHLPHP